MFNYSRDSSFDSFVSLGLLIPVTYKCLLFNRNDELFKGFYWFFISGSVGKRSIMSLIPEVISFLTLCLYPVYQPRKLSNNRFGLSYGNVFLCSLPSSLCSLEVLLLLMEIAMEKMIDPKEVA